MTIPDEIKKYITDSLAPLTPIFAKASIGDFSQDIEIPEEDNGFVELYTGIQVMLDVIRQKIAILEEEVDAREKIDERLQRVLDNMIEGFQIIGFDWKYLYVNDAVVKQGKKPKEDLLGHTMTELYPGIEKTELFGYLKRCMEERTAHQMENEFTFQDGNKGWFELRIEPISEGIFILSLDITERKRQQAELTKIASIVESSTDAIIGKDLNGIITSWNPAAEKLYGYIEKEVIGKSISILFPEDRKSELDGIMESIRQGKQIEHFETKRVTRDGKIIDMSVNISPIKNEKGVIIGASSIGRDITHRKQQEAEMQRLAAIVESSDDAIIGKTIEGDITTWNSGAEKLYGYTAAEMIGKSNSILIPEDHTQEWPEFTDRLSKGEIIKNFETVRVTKDGRKIDVSITFSPIKDETGKITGSSAIVRDITERKKVDTMKSEFVALASHQLKTPLTSIRWYSELLLKNSNTQLNEKQIKYLKVIYQSNSRMIALVNSLLNVSRIDLGTFMVNPALANLTEVIDSVIEENSVLIAERKIKIIKNYEKDIPPMLLDQNVMRIILSNLISNATRYSFENGVVTISTQRVGDKVDIKFSDTGIGIPEIEKNKIFKKFSRADNAMTQSADGSGLGLYIVKSIVDQTGGTISFISEEKKGSTFTLSYPVSGMMGRDGTRHLH